jgi:hypothetical protein
MSNGGGPAPNNEIQSFVRRVLFGGIGFVLILLFAVGLNYITSYVEKNSLLPVYYVYVLRGIEGLLSPATSLDLGTML